MKTYKGKIGRMPFTVREALCQRLRDGQMGPALLKWLNESQGLRGAAAVNAQNLSEWRQGGYQDWLSKEEKVDTTRQLGELALRLGEAATGGVAGAAATIAGGRIMEKLEAASQDSLLEMANTLAALRQAETASKKAEQEGLKIQQKDRELAQKDQVIALEGQKFQRQTCELFLKWFENKRAAEIAGGSASNAAKIEQLGQLMFKETWRPKT